MKKILLPLLALFTLCSLLNLTQAEPSTKVETPTPPPTQNTEKKLILRDLVTIKDNKMLYEEHWIIKKEKDGNTQASLFAEAPETGVISRDRFIALTNSLAMDTFLEILVEEDTDFKIKKYLNKVSYQYLAEIIGRADIEFHIFFNAAGVKIEIKDIQNNENYSETMTWKDILEDS